MLPEVDLDRSNPSKSTSGSISTHLSLLDSCDERRLISKGLHVAAGGNGLQLVPAERDTLPITPALFLSELFVSYLFRASNSAVVRMKRGSCCLALETPFRNCQVTGGEA